mgnify:CR=1 FL=1
MTLRHILKNNTIKNLEILHNCQVVTVTSGYTNCQQFIKSELSEILNFLLFSYDYKEPIEDVKNILIRDGEISIILIWDQKIIVLYLQLIKNHKFCCFNKYDYNFKTTSYFLELQINDTIFDNQLKNILTWPTKAKVKSFIENN